MASVIASLKSRSTWLRAGTFVAALAGVALLAGFGGGQAPGTAFADGLRFLPDDCQVVAVCKVDEMLQSACYKELVKLGKDLPGANFGDIDKESEKLYGMLSNNIGHMTMGMSLANLDINAFQPGQTPPGIVVLRCLKGVTAEDLKAKMTDRKFTEARAGAFTIHQADDWAFCVVDRQTVVYGAGPVLKKSLERNKAPQLSAGMQAVLKQIERHQTMAVAFSLKEILARKDVQQGLQNAPGAEFVNNIEGVTMQFGMASDLDVSVGITCKDAQSADDLKKAAEGGIALIKLTANKDVPREAIEILNAIKISSRGTQVEGTLKFKTETLRKLIQQGIQKGI